MLRQHTHQVFGAFLGSSTRVAQVAGQALVSPITVSRYTEGANDGGRYGFTAIPSGTFTGSLTVWYSHLPNPDPDVEADWFQDTDLGTITLTSGVTVGRAVGNITTDWVRYKVNVATGTLNLSLWHRADRGD